jgi:hypothetical protein
VTTLTGPAALPMLNAILGENAARILRLPVFQHGSLERGLT